MATNHKHPHVCSTLDVVKGGVPPQAGHARRAALLNSAFWGRGAELSVAFVEGDPGLQQRVAELAQAWPDETGANFSFDFRIGDGSKPGDADIRIGFATDDGSWSVLGKFAQQVPASDRTMNLGWMTLALPQDEARAVVLHEFGHALGLIHEHLSPEAKIEWNVKKVVADLRSSQGWDDETIKRNMFALFPPEDIFATDLDPHSIMMYPIEEGWTKNGFTVGFNTDLTASDRKLILEAYGPKSVFGAPRPS